MATYSDRGAADKLGISIATLWRYIKAGKITAPRMRRLGPIKVRLWTDKDIDRVRKMLPEIYYKHLGKR